MNHERGEDGPRSMCWRDAVKRLNENNKDDAKTLKERECTVTRTLTEQSH